MGYGLKWENREKTSSIDFFSARLNNEDKLEEVVDVASIGFQGEAYVALKTPNGIKPLIIDQSWRSLWYWFNNFGWRAYEEWDVLHLESKPRCPRRILEMLAPVELLYPDDTEKQKSASLWRQRAWEALAVREGRPSVKKGSLVTFASPIEFTDGAVIQTLRWMHGSTFTNPENNGRYRIRNWRERNWKTVTAAAS